MFRHADVCMFVSCVHRIRIPLFWKYIRHGNAKKVYYICSWKPKLWLLPLAFRLPNYNIYIYIYNSNDRNFEIKVELKLNRQDLRFLSCDN